MHEINNKVLKKTGTQIYFQKTSPIHESQWRQLEELVSNKDFSYEVVKSGDLDEEAFGYGFRIKKTGEDKVYEPTIMNYIQHPKLQSFYDMLCEGEAYEIDRCQIAHFPENGVLGRHRDTDRVSTYKYALVFFFSDDYEGGEFVVYADNESYSYKPKKYSILVTDCTLEHELKRITKGSRKVLHVFLNSIDQLNFQE